MDEGHTDWLGGELAACNLADERLTKRLRKLLGQIGGRSARAYPLHARDWANAKGAYRFLSNDRVNEADILAGTTGTLNRRGVDFHAELTRVFH